MPAYDPNSFSDGISHLEWKMLSDNDHVPLMNKVLQGLYPPGSTVKPMNGLALLERRRQPATIASCCTGALRVGTGIFHCHKKSGHGALDLKQRDHAELRHLFLRDGPAARLRSCRAGRAHARARAEIRPALHQPALRHRARQRMEAAANTRRTGPSPIRSMPRSARAMCWPIRLQLAVMASRHRVGPRARSRRIAGGPRPCTAPRAAGRSPSICRSIRDGDVGRGQRRRHRRRGADADAGRRARRQDRHRAGPPDHDGRARVGRAQERLSCRSSCATTRCSWASRPPTSRAMPLAVVLEHGGHTVRNLDTPMIAPRHHDLSVRPRPRAGNRWPRSSRPGAATSATRMAARGRRLPRRRERAAARAAARPKRTRPRRPMPPRSKRRPTPPTARPRRSPTTPRPTTASPRTARRSRHHERRWLRPRAVGAAAVEDHRAGRR